MRKCRLDRGLWQRTVANELGVREETITLWETGRARPLPRHYGKIFRFLGSDPEAEDPMVAGRLRAMRRRRGLTQAELAAVAGMDEGTICRWESGRRPGSWMEPRLTALLGWLEEEPSARGPEGRVRQPEIPRAATKDLRAARYGEQLRLRRHAVRLTQVELGKRLGVDPRTLRRWERGDFLPRARHRAATEAMLGVPPIAGSEDDS